VIVIPRELHRVPLSLNTVLSLVRWQHADPHPVLATTPVWRDPEAAAAQDRRATDELRRLGLHDGRRLTPDFADAVDTLVHPRRELYGWLTQVENGVVRRRGLLAVSAYQVGVVLVRLADTDHTVLAVVPPSRVAAAFAGELPDVPAAPGREITTDYRTCLVGLSDTDGFDGFGADDDPDVQKMRELLRQPRVGSGELYAAARDMNGNRRRIERPVVYLDTHQGRRIAERRTGRDDTASLIPADAGAVTERLVRWLAAAEPR
jgi:hypothetical protein